MYESNSYIGLVETCTAATAAHLFFALTLWLPRLFLALTHQKHPYGSKGQALRAEYLE